MWRWPRGRPTALVACVALLVSPALGVCSGDDGQAAATRSPSCPILLRSARMPTGFPAGPRFHAERVGDPAAVRCSVTDNGTTWSVSATKRRLSKAQHVSLTKDFDLRRRLGAHVSVDGAPAAAVDLGRIHTLFVFDGETYGTVSVVEAAAGDGPTRRELIGAARLLLDARASS